MSQEKLSNMETGGEGSHTPSLGVISQEKLSTNMGGGESHTPSHVLPLVDGGKYKLNNLTAYFLFNFNLNIKLNSLLLFIYR